MQSDDCNKDCPIVCMMKGSQSINSCTTWRRNHLFLINFVQSSGLLGESQIDSICSFFSHCEPFQAKSSYFISSQVTSQVKLFPSLLSSSLSSLHILIATHFLRILFTSVLNTLGAILGICTHFQSSQIT